MKPDFFIYGNYVTLFFSYLEISSLWTFPIYYLPPTQKNIILAIDTLSRSVCSTPNMVLCCPCPFRRIGQTVCPDETVSQQMPVKSSYGIRLLERFHHLLWKRKHTSTLFTVSIDLKLGWNTKTLHKVEHNIPKFCVGSPSYTAKRGRFRRLDFQAFSCRR